MEEKKKAQDTAKRELDMKNMEEVSGGSDIQVEINNTVTNNEHPVDIGPTYVINM